LKNNTVAALKRSKAVNCFQNFQNPN